MKYTHSIICPTHGPLIDLTEHSYYLSRFFACENPSHDNYIYYWFQIASGIISIEYQSDRYDDSVFQCRPTMEYEEEKSKFHSKLIKALTTFNFIWGGFEAFLNSVNIPECPYQGGKINDASFWLLKNYDPDNVPLRYYPQVVEYLKGLIVKNSWYGDPKVLFKKKNCEGASAEGISIVYKIRNKLAHGDFQFSEPEEWNSEKPLDLPIINSASRIVLLTTQMMLSTFHQNSEFLIDVYHNEMEEEEEGVLANIFLKTIHMKTDSVNGNDKL